LIVKQDYDKRNAPERLRAAKGTLFVARRIQRPAVRGKKRKSAAKRKGDPRTPEEFVDLRKEFLGEADQHKGDPRTWPFLLQDLEASKAIKKRITGPREVISEAFVRDSISRHLGIRPEDVTRNQIRHAVVDLLPYCPAITVIPAEPIKDTRADLEVAKDSTGIIGSKKKRGPRAKMEFHRAVAEVVRSFGPNWKEHLEQIAGKLGKRNLPPLAAWANRNPPARSWRRAVEYYPELVVKALEYSLEMAAKDIAGKSSETLGNVR
jgi:hypothetical protein